MGKNTSKKRPSQRTTEEMLENLARMRAAEEKLLATSSSGKSESGLAVSSDVESDEISSPQNKPISTKRLDKGKGKAIEEEILNEMKSDFISLGDLEFHIPPEDLESAKVDILDGPAIEYVYDSTPKGESASRPVVTKTTTDVSSGEVKSVSLIPNIKLPFIPSAVPKKPTLKQTQQEIVQGMVESSLYEEITLLKSRIASLEQTISSMQKDIGGIKGQLVVLSGSTQQKKTVVDLTTFSSKFLPVQPAMQVVHSPQPLRPHVSPQVKPISRSNRTR